MARLRARAEVGGVPLAHEVTVEGEDFADLPAGLIAVVQHQGVDAGVDTVDLEAQVGNPLERERPVAAKRVLAAHNAAGLGQGTRRDRRCEDDVVGEVSEHSLEVV